MIVVADTSPINYLLLIGCSEVLPSLFEIVVIPGAVLTELRSEKAPATVQQWARSLPEWVSIRTADHLLPELTSFGSGEREAISLAYEIKADAVLIDDATARRVAERLGLSVVGTLGVLETAADLGFIQLDEALDRLADTTFRAAPEVLRTIQKRHQQRRS